MTGPTPARRRVRLAAVRRARGRAERRSTGAERDAAVDPRRAAARDRAAARVQRGRRARAPPTSTSPRGSRALARRGRTRRSMLAAALAVRGAAARATSTSTSRRSATPRRSTPTSRSTSAALPWPDRAAGRERVGREPAAGDGEASAAAARGLAALPRPLLARGAPGRRRPARAGRRTARGRRRRCSRAGLERLFRERRRQRDAAEAAVRTRLAVVAGGPGTGKTTTVARDRRAARRAGARPDAGAAHRARRADRQGGGAAERGGPRGGGATLDASTRGARAICSRCTPRPCTGCSAGGPDSHSRFRHDRGNRLPHDVVDRRRDLDGVAVADGAAGGGGPPRRAARSSSATPASSPRSRPAPCSATSSPARQGLRRHARPRPTATAAASPRVAEAIRRGDADATRWPRSPPSDVDLDRDPAADEAAIRAAAARRRRAAPSAAARAGDARAALEALGAFRLLCAHRRGPHGVAGWTARVEPWLGSRDRGDGWYAGRPLLVTENDYELGLYNGDTGVVVAAATGPPRRGVRAPRRARSSQPRRGSPPSTRSTR